MIIDRRSSRCFDLRLLSDNPSGCLAWQWKRDRLRRSIRWDCPKVFQPPCGWLISAGPLGRIFQAAPGVWGPKSRRRGSAALPEFEVYTPPKKRNNCVINCLTTKQWCESVPRCENGARSAVGTRVNDPGVGGCTNEGGGTAGCGFRNAERGRLWKSAKSAKFSARR